MDDVGLTVVLRGKPVSRSFTLLQSGNAKVFVV